MVKQNLFSQITDSSFYSGGPWSSWYLTDNITMTNTSQTYTTVVSYSGQIDSSSTSYGPGGIINYTYTTTTDGNITASVHPYEYVTTTVQSTTNIVQNTSVSSSYSVGVEQSGSGYHWESNTFYYAVGRVVDTCSQEVTMSNEITLPSNITSLFYQSVEVYNYISGGAIGDTNSTFSTTVRFMIGEFSPEFPFSQVVDLSDLYWDAPGTLAQFATRFEKHWTDYLCLTYKSFNGNTTSLRFSKSSMKELSPVPSSGTSVSSQFYATFETSFAYFTYYSKSTSWNTLTTINTSYEVPGQTTSSWVVPSQVSSLIS